MAIWNGNKRIVHSNSDCGYMNSSNAPSFSITAQFKYNTDYKKILLKIDNSQNEVYRSNGTKFFEIHCQHIKSITRYAMGKG